MKNGHLFRCPFHVYLPPFLPLESLGLPGPETVQTCYQGQTPTHCPVIATVVDNNAFLT